MLETPIKRKLAWTDAEMAKVKRCAGDKDLREERAGYEAEIAHGFKKIRELEADKEELEEELEEEREVLEGVVAYLDEEYDQDLRVLKEKLETDHAAVLKSAETRHKSEKHNLKQWSKARKERLAVLEERLKVRDKHVALLSISVVELKGVPISEEEVRGVLSDQKAAEASTALGGAAAAAAAGGD